MIGGPGYARPCRSGRHIIPANRPSCDECRVEHQRAYRSGERERTEQTPEYLRQVDLPLAEVLENAACSPELAYLFDVGAPRSEKPQEAQRHAAARQICDACPVADACYADAYAHHAMGFYGGVAMDAGFWTSEGKRKAARSKYLAGETGSTTALVRVMPSVQDSTAC